MNSVHQKVVLAKKGDQVAFQELMQESQDQLYRMAYTYVRNEADAIEIVQDTYFKAYKSIEKLKNPQYFHTWLTRILINNALSFIKQRKRFVRFSEKQMENHHNITHHPEEKIDLLNAIWNLPEKYKTIINLRYYMDYSQTQIAEILDIPEGTVKTRIHRATDKLKTLLKEDYLL